MAGKLLYPGSILSLSAQAADRLMKAGSGDAALLYLYLIRSGGKLEPHAAAHVLSFTPDRLKEAFSALVTMGLADPEEAVAPPPPPPEPKAPPEYTAADLTRELDDKASSFPGLVGEVQRRLGKILSVSDLKMLYTLYDYLALPAEVIMLLVSCCIEEQDRKYGPGHQMPRLSQIQREGFAWRRQGIDTLEAAEEFLKKRAELRERTRSVLALLGVRDRAPVDQERDYIASWVEMGFDDPAIRLAYERTILQKQKMNWRYMNSILRHWHQKGLHTVAAIQQGDTGPRSVTAPAPMAPSAAAADSDQRVRDDLERMRAYLQSQKGEK